MSPFTPQRAARVLVQALRQVELRAAGDAAGHEFHGNQWTEGQAGGSQTTKEGSRIGGFMQNTPHARTTEGELHTGQGAKVVTWTDHHGKDIQVKINEGVPVDRQIALRDALGRMPSQVLEAAGNKNRIDSEVPTGRPGFEMTPTLSGGKVLESVHGVGTTAAGSYSHGENRIAIANSTSAVDMPHVLAHELGHGLDFNSSVYFGRKEINQAYREDKQRIVNAYKGKGVPEGHTIGELIRSYREHAYYRANRKESIAEAIAVHLHPTTVRSSELYARTFTSSYRVAGNGLAKLAARKAKV